MTETGFYILLCLRNECHGYHIVKEVEALTKGEILITTGTLYGSLSKEVRRIRRLNDTIQEVFDNETQ